MKTEVTHESLKASPPVAVTVAWMNGLTMNELVAIATLAYIALQAGYLIWKWIREYKRTRRRD